MRTIVEMPDEMIQSLDRICQRERESRAAIIRKAIREYLIGAADAVKEPAFGIWSDDVDDGLTKQANFRKDWGDD